MPSMFFRGVAGSCKTTKFQNCDFEWKFENFFLRTEAVNDYFHSPPFSVSGQPFYLELYPYGMEDDPGWIGFFLILRRSCPAIKVQYTVSIKKADGETAFLRRGTYTFSNKLDSHGFNLVKRVELLRRKQELVPSDTLTIAATLKEIPKIPTVGKLREGHCTQLGKEVFWDIDNATRLLKVEKGLSYSSPRYTFGTQQCQMGLYIDDYKTELKLFMPRSKAGYLRWNLGILRVDGTEYFTTIGQVILTENWPELEPIGRCFAPPKSELIRQKVAIISADVLTFSVKISIQQAEEAATAMPVMKIIKPV